MKNCLSKPVATEKILMDRKSMVRLEMNEKGKKLIRKEKTMNCRKNNF